MPFITAWACVLMTAIAAVIDFGISANSDSLTPPAIIGGPVLWGWYGGVKAFNTEPMLASGLGAILSGFLCGGTLYFALYRTRISGEHAMGAGDIKLFAALGSLGLIRLGLESMFYAVTAGTLFTLGRLAWRGVLLKTLGNAAFVLLRSHFAEGSPSRALCKSHEGALRSLHLCWHPRSSSLGSRHPMTLTLAQRLSQSMYSRGGQ